MNERCLFCKQNYPIEETELIEDTGYRICLMCSGCKFIDMVLHHPIEIGMIFKKLGSSKMESVKFP